MQLVRDVVTEGLQLRSEASIKVRQPLQSLTASITEIGPEYHDLILDELNIKELHNGPLSLNTDINDELQAEGNMRELLRQIQSLRKSSGLEPHDVINLHIQTSAQGQVLMETFSNEIKSTAGVKDFNFTHNDGEEIKVENLIFIIAIEKQ